MAKVHHPELMESGASHLPSVGGSAARIVAYLDSGANAKKLRIYGAIAAVTACSDAEEFARRASFTGNGTSVGTLGSGVRFFDFGREGRYFVQRLYPAKTEEPNTRAHHSH